MNDYQEKVKEMIEKTLMFTNLTFIGEGNFGCSFSAIKGKYTVFLKSINQKFRSINEQSFCIKQIERYAIVNHPLILKTNLFFAYDEEQNGAPIFYSSYLPNGSLAQYMTQGDFSPTQKTLILSGVACALAALEEHGLPHLALYPSNILLNSKCEPFITHYGLGFISTKGAEIDPNIYKNFSEYIPKESYKTRKSDLFSFLILCRQIIEGRSCKLNKSPTSAPFGYRRLYEEINSDNQFFRPPFHSIVARFASGELVVPGTDMNVFNNFMRKVATIKTPMGGMRASAYMGSVRSMVFVASAYDTQESVFLSHEAAMYGDQDALLILAKHLINGYNIERNCELALELLKKVDTTESLFMRGKILTEEFGDDSGLDMIKEAASLGLPEASLFMANHDKDERYISMALFQCNNDRERVMSLEDDEIESLFTEQITNTRERMIELEWLAKNGNGYSAVALGLLLKNYERSFALFLQAASQNVPVGLFHAGIYYYEGKGVEKDYVKARIMFMRAIETQRGTHELVDYIRKKRNLGEPIFVFLYGYLYHIGCFVEKNEEKAMKAFNRAKTLKDPFGTYFADGCSKTVDNCYFGQELCKAAEMQSPEALLEHGQLLLYSNSQNDNEKALEYLDAAVQYGVEGALVLKAFAALTYKRQKSQTVYRATLERAARWSPLARTALSVFAMTVDRTEQQLRISVSQFAKDWRVCPDAQFFLGFCLYIGLGITKDVGRAKELFRGLKGKTCRLRLIGENYLEHEVEASKFFRTNPELYDL